MTAQAADEWLSAECAVGNRSGYEHLHGACRQTKDIPLHHSTRILLQRRCRCSCHRRIAGAS